MKESLWQIWQPDEEALETCSRLSNELHISEASARLLVFRNIRSAEAARAYIRPSLSQQHDPMLMRDMDKAVERLTRAVRQQERILIYGDYDVDGTTAVSLVYRTLRPYVQHLDYYIPDRYTEGYGISYKGVDYAIEQQCTLIIALDCGIKEMDKVAYAAKHHIDFIICDHHTPGDTIPDAVAVLNIQRKDCPYPYKGLSGCGVGYKFMQAWLRSEGKDEQQLQPALQLLAMSIASDIMPLTDENRMLAYFGLKGMNTNPLTGVKSLMEVAGIAGQVVTMQDLQFKIGPRINASGRIHSGSEAVALLITDNENEAQAKAQDINTYNSERRQFQDKVAQEALELLQQDPDNDRKHTTVVFSPDWNKGVVGIAASRLIETYYRPTIVLTASEGGLISGSARSVAGYNIYDAIDSCRDLLTHFGGHAFAAGVTLPIDRLDEFKQRLEDYVSRTIRPEQMQPTIHIEQEIALTDITPQFYQIIRHLEPFGPDNPRPTFVTRQLINNRYTRRVGKGEHLHIDLTDTRVAIEGIAFNKGDWAPYLQNGNAVDVCYSLEENTFNHRTTLQMRVQDLKESSSQPQR